MIDQAFKKKLIVRWSLVSAGLIAGFWLLWYVIVGTVPNVSSISIGEDYIFELSFKISRWWDIAIGPLWSTVFVLFVSNKRIQQDEDLRFAFIVGLMAGAIAGMVFPLNFDAQLAAVLTVLFVCILGLVFGIAGGILFALVFAATFVLAVGMLLGLVFGILNGLLFLFLVVLVFGIKRLYAARFWSAVWKWLLGA